MSRDTYCDLVPFCARLEDQPEDVGMVFNGSDEDDTANGWKWEYEGQPAGRDRKLLADSFALKGMRVWVINESPYANVGRMCCSIFADKREWLEAFMRDFGISAEIEPEAICTQTI